jgi:Sec-independent protein secretion pathway component TatC
VSQLLLAIPLCLLYEFGLQVARFTGVSPSRAEADAEAAAAAASPDTGGAAKDS